MAFERWRKEEAEKAKVAAAVARVLINRWRVGLEVIYNLTKSRTMEGVHSCCLCGIGSDRRLDKIFTLPAIVAINRFLRQAGPRKRVLVGRHCSGI